VQLGPRDTRRVYAFTLKVKLLRASEVNKAQGAASGASAPASAASGVARS